MIEFWCDPDAVAAVLPAGLEPYADDPGRGAALFVDWQSCVADRNELLDPARSQYKEFFLILNAMLDGEHVTTCPAIWVDRDFALVRGWIQGFPKKLGSMWMTRTFGLDCMADPGVRPGATFAGTLAANDRRLAEGTVTLERVSRVGPDAQRPAARERPPLPAARRRAARDAGRARAGRARGRANRVDLADLGGHRRRSSCSTRPNEEHVALQPVRMGKGFRFTFAYTVDDLETMRDLRRERRGARHRRRQRHRRGDRADGSPRDGWRVAVNGRRREPIAAVAAEHRRGRDRGRYRPIPPTAERVVAETVAALGGLDCVVCNAGISHSGTVLEQTPESFERVLRTNLIGVVPGRACGAAARDRAARAR